MVFKSLRVGQITHDFRPGCCDETLKIQISQLLETYHLCFWEYHRYAPGIRLRRHNDFLCFSDVLGIYSHCTRASLGSQFGCLFWVQMAPKVFQAYYVLHCRFKCIEFIRNVVLNCVYDAKFCRKFCACD